ncbi:MAG: hypothetical protein R3F56_11795 [Planctomycetota bacterium]
MAESWRHSVLGPPDNPPPGPRPGALTWRAMRPRRLAWSTIPLLFVLLDRVPAQTPVRPILLPGLRASSAATRPAPDATSPQTAIAQATPDEDATANGAGKLARLRALKFDRRPSVILRAWAAPEPKSIEQEDADKAKSGAAAPEPTPPAEAPAAGDIPAVEGAPPPIDRTEGDAPAADRADAGAASAETTAKAAADAKEKALAARKLARELEVFQRDVTLGRWDRVGAFLAALPKAEQNPAYEHLLRNLANPAFLRQPDDRVPPDLRENNAFVFDDVLGLAAACPGDLDKKQVPLLVPLFRRALDQGGTIEDLLALLRQQVARPEPERVLSPRHAALLLSGLGRDADLEPFLPTLDEASRNDDREAFNLLARFAMALYAKDKKTEHLGRAWQVTQAALAAGTISDAEKAEALRRAVDLAPKIQAELGQAWLAESFGSRPDRGKEILATIGAAAAQGFQTHGRDIAYRQQGLELQKTAVDALLRAAPERAGSWREALSLLARNWIEEASWCCRASTSNSRGPVLQRDVYGNIYYEDAGRTTNAQVQPVAAGDLLEARPTGAWLDNIEPSVRPDLDATLARLYLKVDEEDHAFPHLETLARTHPERGKELAHEFLRTWIRTHDPNAARSRTSRYVYMYGFEERREAIPLTRSKQERNLQELAQWVARLRALPVEELDEDLLVEAFTKAHSTAEVYRLETIERVFGSMEALQPKTLAGLLEQMRANLGGVWRRADVQENAKTKRNQKDIDREVLEGYRTAGAVVAHALARHPEHWALLLVQAALAHDENNFRHEVDKSADFAPKRVEALAAFAHAAERYAAVAGDLAENEQSAQAYETWFYAALGASDLRALSDENALMPGEPAKLRAAIQSLPGELAERHMGLFANSLFTRLSAVKPTVKFRYLRAGFDIVGDHKQAFEARRVFEYYRDLVTEVKLVARIDGDDRVGHDQPFGVRVDLVHTSEIERESGGFGKYLQNQNNQRFAYNYGRPLEDYRDKFQEAASQALREHFDVLSVTFNDEAVRSKAGDQYGWRVTPYAYLLLEARGPQVDTLPPLRIDLDFLDTSGYAVLPIESPAVPLDAATASPEPRPCTALSVTQVLDERQADQGKLTLEVKATGHGLVPDFDSILAFDPAGFDVVKRDDPGVSVSKFADDQVSLVCERTFVLTLRAKPGEEPTSFRFATARAADTEMNYQRYADADLVSATPAVNLDAHYGQRRFPWGWSLAGTLLVAAFAAVWMTRRRRPQATVVGPFQVPDPATPFAVLEVLRAIERRDGFASDAQRELHETIRSIEQSYFAQGEGSAVDLRRVAEDWVRRAQ